MRHEGTPAKVEPETHAWKGRGAERKGVGGRVSSTGLQLQRGCGAAE